ncbi:Next to BRCA1, central domain [Dillenia turbinata]|uniref:Next to BRCA1, central domain n=1 Tax=Dillenia turbinata TaxID=194707 RepID=A0AAN8Z2E5_9MAGN
MLQANFGDTLRRFNVSIKDDEQLDLDMNGLRMRVLGLFNLAADADVKLTYVDEDGDVVALVDDEDLRDVMRQCLNPVRINVLLNTDKTAKSYGRSSGSSTPMRSPRVQQPLPNLNPSIAEILKFVPEPFQETLSKLSLDMALKAATSAPVLAELIELLRSRGISLPNLVSQSQVDPEAGTQNGASGTVDPSLAKDPEPLKDGSNMQKIPSGSKVVDPSTKVTQEQQDLGPKSGCTGTSENTAPVSADGLFGSIPQSLENSNLAPSAPQILSNDHVISGSNFAAPNSSADPTKHSTTVPAQFAEFGGGGVSVQYPTDAGNSTVLPTGNSTTSPFSWTAYTNACPLSVMPLSTEAYVPPKPAPPIPPPFRRGYHHSDEAVVFHRGVRCDGCGVHPITGPRFKSKAKEDYDLCSICFSEIGNEADYVRMDRAASFRQPWPLKGLYDPMQRPWVRPPHPGHVMRSFGMKPVRPRLDSRFILDVNVMDGTIVLPSTAFTKIWRMRNNGTIVWPRGTQLMWIGGDRFSTSESVELEIPVDGLPVEKELDVAVDFKAPELPGRYISYWRMALPSGQKFGQRVWVLIQVVTVEEDSASIGSDGINLNLPPEGDARVAEVIDVNVEPLLPSGLTEFGGLNKAEETVRCSADEQSSNFLIGSVPKPGEVADKQINLLGASISKPHNSETAEESGKQSLAEKPADSNDQNFPINDTLLVGSGVLEPVLSEVPQVSYPIIDFSPPSVPVSATLLDVPTSSAGPSGNHEVEQTLLKELEDMGFKQVDLNKEILRRNEYNLEQSVDDLCGVSEWDPILEELNEMGFCDREINKKLLKKNNGSIKRVVMDLIAGEE